ncbi:hypothetical protein PHAVU_011G201600 [Phaseolus vulgaris]|uniref:Uncharacterized protein n=3 Tax=Phaseolus vulgaris TaxID=3885 RepID=V7AJH4_PHAVU|nr:hypothetical protein PHAVU_011G201600g [Phaseolus vulgaris]XP_007133701.1 hypothetical protein PHAVU_011G201600g [Phaseolus vulgaris]ESW05694.1 hypothetical protein PHAVU_011G201600g [Phaseolus vulgaris]ESW05695.1 hypothetical protein PHAVU_011G201600g [Phaseolus vulgaris]
MKFDRTDALSILSQIKRQDKQIKLKSRWLLSIPPTRSERKKLKKYFKNRNLSESLIREDDMFYESVKAHVEDALGAHRFEQESDIPKGDMDLIQTLNVKRLISPLLDNLTTKGLYLLAMIVTGSSFNSEITRCKMKKVIKGSLSSVFGRKSSYNHLETCKQIFSLLNNPQNFRDRCEPLGALRSLSCHAAAENVLHRLQNLSSQTLIAMRRKLKGVKAPVPQLQPRKHGWARDHLIKLVKKIGLEMLSKLDKESELQEPLANAMAVADLSLKLTTGSHNIFSKEFYQFSPEVKSLQSDIMNAIWSVKKVTTVPELRNLQLLIEPKAIISNRCIRTAFVNFLTEFLFECSDMDSVPKSLSQTLNVINRGPNSGGLHNVLFKKKYIEEEVDGVLNISALTKQIVLDLLPDDEFDKDFTDAYMEQLEESDDSDSDEDDGSQLQEDIQFRNGSFDSIDSCHEAESIGDFVPFELLSCTIKIEENVSSSPLAVSDRWNSGSEQIQSNKCFSANLESEFRNTPRNMLTDQCQAESTEHFSTFTAGKNNNSSFVSPDRELDEKVVKRNHLFESGTIIAATDTTNWFSEDKEPVPSKYSACKNQYLAIQDACDKTSMLAYSLVGHMLEEFVKTEGQDLSLSKSLYLSGNIPIEDVEDIEEKSSSGKHARDFVQVIEELIPSFPDSSMERLKMLIGSR